MEVVIFGAGCFWGVEDEFRRIPGVTATSVGYAGGNTEHPTYEEVCSKGTGHAEVVRVQYDPERVSFSELLRKFWKIHNSAAGHLSRRDLATYQYRSVIFYTTSEQAAEASAQKDLLEKSGRYPSGILTQILPAPEFHPAEERHQKYYAKREERLRQTRRGA